MYMVFAYFCVPGYLQILMFWKLDLTLNQKFSKNIWTFKKKHKI